jgi:hypothetical protein
VFDFLLSYYKKAKRERINKNFRNHQHSEYYYKVIEEAKYELLPLAYNEFDEMLFSENSFEAKQNRAAMSNLSFFSLLRADKELCFGTDRELCNEFINGNINCIYPRGSSMVINHNLYINALEVFYKLYESKYGKKPLVYLCIPNGDMLNILYSRRNGILHLNRDINFYDEFDNFTFGIQSFVFNSVTSSYALTGKGKLKDFGDFAEIICRININGLIYRVA